jgi:hypothetical protein
VPRPKGLPKTGGRQKGVANTRTREIADSAIGESLTPLEYVLAVLRDETADPARRATRWRGQLRLTSTRASPASKPATR